jgi:hypothetical protein
MVKHNSAILDQKNSESEVQITAILEQKDKELSNLKEDHAEILTKKEQQMVLQNTEIREENSAELKKVRAEAIT